MDKQQHINKRNPHATDEQTSTGRTHPRDKAEGRQDGTENQPGENRELQHQVHHEQDQQSQ